jgi:hypothetical protein
VAFISPASARLGRVKLVKLLVECSPDPIEADANYAISCPNGDSARDD